MDESSRSRPSIHPALFPTCSTPPFPFFPPPPTVDRNGYPCEIPRRDIPPPFHHPIGDSPFPNNRAPPPPSRVPILSFGRRSPVHSTIRRSWTPPPVPNPMPAARDTDLSYECRSILRSMIRSPPPARHFHGESSERVSYPKRMRVEDQAIPGNFPTLQPSSRDDLYAERRLNPIRDPIFSHQSHPVPANPFVGYQSDRFVIQERRDFQFEAIENGAFSYHSGEHPSYRRRRQCDTSPRMARGYRHGDPVGSSEDYVARAPRGYNHGGIDGSSEDYVARAPRGYNHGGFDGSSDDYVAHPQESYRWGEREAPLPEDEIDICFSCGKEGHWSRTCRASKMEREEFKRRKKLAEATLPEDKIDICFLCGKEGHWSRTCGASKKERDEYKRRNKYAEARISEDWEDELEAKEIGYKRDICFKCGREGHWSRTCHASREEREEFKRRNTCC